MRESDYLPEFPRTRHLPWNPNATDDDPISDKADAEILFSAPRVYVEEKVDGANCGIALVNEHPIVRNRSHILHKGFIAKKTSAAKMQFASIFNWYYQNEKCFKKLYDLAGPVSVYGEWLLAQHGMEYDRLPSLFVAYDLYDYTAQQYIDPGIARASLTEAGFAVVPLIHEGTLTNYVQVEEWSNGASPFSSKTPREGVYIKVGDGRWLTHRFKLVRAGFVQGALWSERSINKNKVQK